MKAHPRRYLLASFVAIVFVLAVLSQLIFLSPPVRDVLGHRDPAASVICHYAGSPYLDSDIPDECEIGQLPQP